MLMKTLQVGELKSRFSSVLEAVRRGEEIAISFGKRKERLAVIVPYSKYKKGVQRKLGILKNKASFELHEGFKISDEELLNP
jgi:prevent-host-death family protein